MVSNEAALNALMASAEARQRERNERPRKRTRDETRGGGNHHQRRHRHRSERDRRREDDTVKGHYGPRNDDNRRERDNNVKRDNDDSDNDDKNDQEAEKPNFGLSGALAKDESRGNVYKGVVLKFSEPPEARAPNTQWRFYVFRKKQGEESSSSNNNQDDPIETLHVSRQSAYLLGRNEDICDVPLRHASCSSQHAVLQYRALPNSTTGRLHCQPYLMDLESTNGSFINSVRIEPARYYQLKKGDVLQFGASTREYVLLTANTTSIDQY